MVLAAPGCSRLLLAAPGCSWLLQAAPNCLGLLVALGCSRLLRAPPGCSWLLVPAPGCSWLLLAALGCSMFLWPPPGCSLLLLAAPGCSDCCWQLLAAAIDWLIDWLTDETLTDAARTDYTAEYCLPDFDYKVPATRYRLSDLGSHWKSSSLFGVTRWGHETLFLCLLRTSYQTRNDNAKKHIKKHLPNLSTKNAKINT